MEDYRSCKICNTRIDHRGLKAIYCSKFCYNNMLTEKYRAEMRARTPEKTCLTCGVKFKPESLHSRKFCTSACAYTARNAKMKVFHTKKQCVHCQEDFFPNRAFQLYCSITCRSAVAMFKKMYEMSAQDMNSLPTPQSMQESMQKQMNIAHAEALAKELEESGYPICTRCAVNRVKDPEAPYQQCPSCIPLTEAENANLQ